MTSDGHDILYNGERINLARDITIGAHVWLADNVTILKGVDIGSGSIIGINATVTKSIDQSCIAAGNPARKIKDNISWNTTLSY
ncbi:acetyltranferase, putative [Vibrio mimicus VM573]|nr:acetyltranferase, putative [Vibrio mimicus VM573]